MGYSEYTCQICGMTKDNGWGSGRDEICDYCYNNAKRAHRDSERAISDHQKDEICVMCDSKIESEQERAQAKSICLDCYINLSCVICGTYKNIAGDRWSSELIEICDICYDHAMKDKSNPERLTATPDTT